MNTAPHSTPSDVHAPSCRTLVDTMVGLGSSWATYGLKLGKVAIQTTAEALGKTAETLDTLASAIQKRAEEIKAEHGAEPAKDEQAEKVERPKAEPPAADAPAA